MSKEDAFLYIRQVVFGLYDSLPGSCDFMDLEKLEDAFHVLKGALEALDDT